MSLPSGARLAFAGLVATAAVEAVHAAHSHTPDLNDVHEARPGDHVAHQLRRGQTLAFVTAAAVGDALALAVGHPGPLLAAAAASLVVLGIYEWHLRKGGA